MQPLDEINGTELAARNDHLNIEFEINLRDPVR
jgi:hypothetical protein